MDSLISSALTLARQKLHSCEEIPPEIVSFLDVAQRRNTAGGPKTALIFLQSLLQGSN
jgi:hypothetical protein